MHPGTSSHKELKFEMPSVIWSKVPLNYPPGGSTTIHCTPSTHCLFSRGLSDCSKLAHIFSLGKLTHGPHEVSHSCVMVFCTEVGVLCLCFTPRCPAVMGVEVLARRGCRLNQALMQYDYHTSRQNTPRTV